MSINKQGIWNQTQYREFGAVEKYNNNTGTYTPTLDGTNSCMNVWAVDLSQYASLNTDIVLRVEVDVAYTGFTGTSEAGTFNLYWQGSNYSIANQAYEWTGTNYITTCLNNQQSLKNLVIGTSKYYHYNNSITIPKSWFDSYSRSNVGLRADYSNGVGTITLSNLKVYLDKDYGNTAGRITNNNISIFNNFIEI